MSLELFAIIFFDYLPDFPYIGSGFQLRFILYFDANFVIRTVNAISFAVKNNFFAGFKNIKLKVRDIGKNNVCIQIPAIFRITVSETKQDTNFLVHLFVVNRKVHSRKADNVRNLLTRKQIGQFMLNLSQSNCLFHTFYNYRGLT